MRLHSKPNLADVAEGDLRAISSHPRFHAMDGLRGIAALTVVLFHSFRNGGLLPNGRLAVDLFFILSGFVIGLSYDAKLQQGLSANEFLFRRFVRLYPMLLIGSVGGIVIAFVHNFTNPLEAYPASSIIIAGFLSVLVLPYMGMGISDNKAFPFNAPLWSLFFEIIANVAYAFVRQWLAIPVLTILTVGGLIAIGILGPLGGGDKDSVAYGIPRVVSGFFGGLLLFKLWRTGQLPRVRGNVILLGAVITGVFMLPYGIGGWTYMPAFAILWLVVLAAANAASSPLDKISSFLGEASYPVYLVHWLTLYIATFVGKRIGLSGHFYWVVVVIHLAVIPFIGFALFHYYEKPVMLKLRQLRPAKTKAEPPLKASSQRLDNGR